MNQLLFCEHPRSFPPLPFYAFSSHAFRLHLSIPSLSIPLYPFPYPLLFPSHLPFLSFFLPSLPSLPLFLSPQVRREIIGSWYRFNVNSLKEGNSYFLSSVAVDDHHAPGRYDLWYFLGILSEVSCFITS